jgi:large subunit ribosomal protein L24
MKKFSRSWLGSKQPRKQRKYRYNAPLNLRGKFMRSHLSKDLRNKYNTRSIRIRKGDKVRIMCGQFAKREGKVDRVDIKRTKVYIENIDISKKDGSKALFPLDPSNLLVLELVTDDKKRMAKLEKLRKKSKAEKVNKE